MNQLLVPLIILSISLLILFLLAKRSEPKVRKDWNALHDLSKSDSYKILEFLIGTNVEAISKTYEDANERKQLGSIEEAKKLLDAGCTIISRFTPNILSLISIMMKFSRMLVAITPFKPLKPGNFKITQLASLAVLNVLVSQFLVSVKDRFRLKMYIIGKGITMAGSYLIKTTKNIITSREEEEKDWEKIEDLLNDYKELSQETLDCLKVIHDTWIIDNRPIQEPAPLSPPIKK
jgi:hypothetical protein